MKDFDNAVSEIKKINPEFEAQNAIKDNPELTLEWIRKTTKFDLLKLKTEILMGKKDLALNIDKDEDPDIERAADLNDYIQNEAKEEDWYNPPRDNK